MSEKALGGKLKTVDMGEDFSKERNMKAVWRDTQGQQDASEGRGSCRQDCGSSFPHSPVVPEGSVKDPHGEGEK